MSRRRARPRGIPTWYRSVRFRSRQEARWACAFDWLAWIWHYEPALDQELGGWLPDFALTIPGRDAPLLAECKPALDHPALGPAAAKVEASGCVTAVVLLGAVWGVALLSEATRTRRRWLPVYPALGPSGVGLAPAPEPDPTVAWWIKSGWVNAGNRTQWRGPR